MKNTTAIALSGGIDSLVAAFLLKQTSQPVLGIHFITGFEALSPEHPPEKALSAIADQLQIPINTIDLQTEFQQRVVDYFVSTYQMGKTPNPCMVCNAKIKFDVLLHHARQFGADFLATGHYVKKTMDEQGRYHLFRGRDAQKDQSYFLSLLTQDQLAAACFPLESLKKSDVVEMARQHHLSPIVQNESQDICFIRNTSYTDFLSEQPGFISQPGPIVDVDGRQIATHNGLHHFTIGQRKGINIPASEPYYVIRLVPEENKLVVGFKPHLLVSRCRVSHINWISDMPKSEIPVGIQVRYRHRAVPGTLMPQGMDKATIVFQTPQSAITPGQGAVFYVQNEVIGGGFIDA